MILEHSGRSQTSAPGDDEDMEVDIPPLAQDQDQEEEDEVRSIKT